MANKRWLLLTTAFCLLVANEFGSTDARPQRSKSASETHLVRFRPITREQYDSILKLTSGKPVISEARLINNGHRSISSISSIITEDLNSRLRSLLNITGLLSNRTSSQDTNGYPLCVIRTTNDGNGRTITENADDGQQSEQDMYTNGIYHSGPYMRPSHGYGGHEEDTNTEDEEQNNNSQRPIVNCIVVVKQPTTTDEEDATCVEPDDAGCAVYCLSHPSATQCCDPETDHRCYCRRNPQDTRYCRSHHSHGGRDRYAGYSPNLYRYPYGFIPYFIPSYDHRSAYSSESSRATPPQALIERNSAQHYGQVDRVAPAAPAKKLAATTKHSTATKPKSHARRANKPAMPEMTRQVAGAGYDYSQLYKQLYDAGYGGARQPQAHAQSPFGYNPYANYQFNPYAGGGFPGVPNAASLRYPAQSQHPLQQQLQSQMYAQFGNHGNYADQSDSDEYSSGEYSGEYSGEDHDDEARAVKAQANDNKKLDHKAKEKKLEKN